MAAGSARPSMRQQLPRASTTAACEACRKLKMRCIRPARVNTCESQLEPCERCRRNNRTCSIPPPRPLGRRPGAVGRYQGLEKARRKIQAELEKARNSSNDIDGMNGLSEREERLLDLLSDVQNSEQHADAELNQPLHGEDLSHLQKCSTQRRLAGAQDFHYTEQSQPHTNSCFYRMTSAISSSDVSQEPVSNPLALLADASETARVMSMPRPSMDTCLHSTVEAIRSIPSSEGTRYPLRCPGHVPIGLQLTKDQVEKGLNAILKSSSHMAGHMDYFRPVSDPSRDTGPDLDPVELGLVSMQEAHMLFSIYFTRLHSVNGILDPKLHTPEYVRSRSCLLFTWILALTAQFDHSSETIAKRLRLHGEKLSRHVHSSGWKSVEVVQGYYISLLSATPAKALSEERSWLYTTHAVGIAIELGLDQGSKSRLHRNPLNNQTRQHSEHTQRLARNRERTWLRILLWERANSAACGRTNVFADTELTRNIDSWRMHPLADATDRHTCAFILLRRLLAPLQNELRHEASLPQADPHWASKLINASLEPWCKTWLQDPYTLPQSQQLPDVFLNYVYLHNRLWTLSFALHASRNTDRHLDAIREDCFDAAVHCCAVAVRDLRTIGEPLYCMLAPTWAMIAYAAVLALKLFPCLYGSGSDGGMEFLALLAQVALQLQKSGTTPSHRLGIAALLGQHLLMVLRSRAVGLGELAAVAGDQNDSAPERTIAYTPINQETDVASPLVSSYDPFLPMAVMGTDRDLANDGFADLFREIFGPGFDEVSWSNNRLTWDF